MQNIVNNSDYVTVALLHKSEKMNVKLTFKGEKKLENMYILNEFPYNKNDLKFFKMLFDIFNSENKPKDFTDFFVTNNNFYAVFKYHQAPNIPLKFKKDLIIANFDERCYLLENILIRIEKFYRSYIEFVGCISEPENINIDSENNVYFHFDLWNMEKYIGKNQKSILENIYKIIYTVMRPEADQGFNKQLHIVLDKCKNGIYTSIPELIIEFKKAAKSSKNSSWWGYVKYQYNLHKPLIKKLTKNLTTISVIGCLIYIAYDRLNQGTAINTSAVISIGDVSYTGDSGDTSEKTLTSEVDAETTTKAKETTNSDITLSEGLDMEYEDYIVQQDDTVTSIAENYYKDKKYATAISTFNGIEINENLIPGTILKLPNRTAIALYISK